MEQVERPEGFEKRWWILGVLCLSLLIIVMDNTILNVALPTLVRKLKASESQLQWMVDSYSLLFAGLLLTMGTLGDRFGRRKTLTIGLAVFAGGSLLSSFSSSAGQLILTRAVMGVGAALIMPATLSILTNVFPAEERAKAIGIWAGISGVAVAIGPVLGGFMLEHFWWGSIFLINVPVCIFAIVVGKLIVPDSRDPQMRKLDPVGAVLSVVGLIAMVYGIIEAPSKGWGSTTILGAMGIAAVVLIAFGIWEIRSDHPMLNLKFFANPRFSAANISITLVFFALFGSIFFLTQYLQFVLHYSALRAGIALVPIALVMMVVAPVSGQLVKKLGTKTLVAAGMAVGAVGLWYLSTTAVASGYPHVLLGLIIIVTGLAMSMVPATESIMGSLPPGQAGVGSAMNDTTREIGGALGVAILGTILSSRYGATIVRSLGFLPPTALAAAKSSVGGAAQVGLTIGGATGQNVINVANAAFIHAMSSALHVAAGIALVGAIVSALWLPNRDPHVEHPVIDAEASLGELGAEAVLAPEEAGI